MNRGIVQAVRTVRAALQRLWSSPSGRPTTVRDPAALWTIGSALDHPDPDLLALAALALGGLVHPADALRIALIEAGRRRDL